MKTYPAPQTTITQSNHLAEVKAIYKSKIKILEQPKMTRSSDIRDYFFSVWDHDQMEYLEHMLVLYLNRQNRVMGWAKISSGGQAATLVDPKVLFSLALATGASQFALAHNHPSGEIKPSTCDINLTQRLVEGGKLLEMPLIDHLILTADKGIFYSFNDEGLIN